MTSSLTPHVSVNDTTRHFSLNSFLVLQFDRKLSHLIRRWKFLRANQCYRNLPFMSIDFLKEDSSIENICVDISSSQFYEKHYYIWCIKWSKCLVCAPCTLSPFCIWSFTAIYGSTISPSSVVKLSGGVQSYQNVNYFQYKDTTVSRQSYLYNGNHHTRKDPTYIETGLWTSTRLSRYDLKTI